jgi:Histidine kinase-, DNA gyrase B-, and HSP90-like ATPase.
MSTTPSSALRALPIDRLTLVFLSPERERAYRDAQFASTRVLLRAALGFSILIHLLFLYVDHLVLSQGAPTLWKLRLMVLIPASASVVLVSFLPIFQRIEQPAVAIAVIINVAMMIVGGVIFPDHIAYFVPGTVMVLIFGYILLGLRFAWSAPLMTLSAAAHVVAVLAQGLPVEQRVIATEVLVLSGVVLTIGAYRMELMSRTEYHAMEQLLVQERREREWLGLMAGFVRHELKNAIAGIGSSLQLVANTSIDDKREEYVRRAAHSLQFMRRFLEQVGTATNLESALHQQESALLSFSELVCGCVDDARQRTAGRTFADCIARDVHVRGNADSLVQMIDKLLNNAIEHSRAESQIEVRLATGEDSAQLEISNIGDALPDDVERLFRPFVTTKSGSAQGNLGLGLYVARTIATFHGGSVTAHALAQPAGARFVVTLPVVRSNAAATTA